MVYKTSAAMTLKVESEVGSLPPWGDNPPARPLSPKRKRIAKVPIKPTLTRRCRSNDFALGWLLVVAALALGSWLIGAKSKDSSPSLQVLPELEQLSSSGGNTGDVFILSDVTQADQFLNYSAANLVHNSDVIANVDPDFVSTDVVRGPPVLMDSLKLEEIGTTWSQPQQVVASVLPPSAISFRLEEQVGIVQERPWTYKLQWWTSKYELEHNEDVLQHGLSAAAARRYELRWHKPVVLFASQNTAVQNSEVSPRGYELRWRK